MDPRVCPMIVKYFAIQANFMSESQFIAYKR